MKRLLAITAMLLLTVAFTMAKSGTTTSSPISSVAPVKAEERAVQGCLSGGSGNYTLTDSLGNLWQLEGSTDQLKGDVGHTVAITGIGGNAAAMTGNSKDYIDVDMASVNDLQVSRVKPISVTCSQQNRRYARNQAADMLAAE